MAGHPPPPQGGQNATHNSLGERARSAGRLGQNGHRLRRGLGETWVLLGRCCLRAARALLGRCLGAALAA
eukprot:11190730-Lingulodinium_polyedra.AAC.1